MDRIPATLTRSSPAQKTRRFTECRNFIRWTPYQQIQFTRSYTSNGEMQGGTVWVNHTGYQFIAELDPNFLARHPELVTEPLDENPYNVPFRFAAPSPEVLIVGSGTGNDVAAALRNGSSSVDAVEIDPAFYCMTGEVIRLDSGVHLGPTGRTLASPR